MHNIYCVICELHQAETVVLFKLRFNQQILWTVTAGNGLRLCNQQTQSVLLYTDSGQLVLEWHYHFTNCSKIKTCREIR